MTLKSRFYDIVASKFYDRQLDVEPMKEVRRLSVEALGLRRGGRVLEIGCGTGLNQPFLADAIGEEGTIIALDASTEMMRKAQDRARKGEYADRIAFLEGDARELVSLTENARDDEYVDGVLLSLILTVLPDWEDVFEKAFSLLAPGGKCVVMDTYWPQPSISQRAISLAYAADPTRPTFQPLKDCSADFEMIYMPPEEQTFFIARGAATAVMSDGETSRSVSEQTERLEAANTNSSYEEQRASG